MSRLAVGKMLLRNVIRHTDAHNKIQEECEMWKLRDMEKQTRVVSPRRASVRQRARDSMHFDRVLEESRTCTRDQISHRAEQEARYWTRKLYEFEAGDPDRWGHSGFKELYPEEFECDSDKGSDSETLDRRKGIEKATSDSKQKHSRRSSRKKKKKKEKKKKLEDSSNDGSEAERSRRKRKRKSQSKAKHRRKRRDSSSNEGVTGQETSRKRRRENGSGAEEPQKKRKDWKSANVEKSEDSESSQD